LLGASGVCDEAESEGNKMNVLNLMPKYGNVFEVRWSIQKPFDKTSDSDYYAWAVEKQTIKAFQKLVESNAKIDREIDSSVVYKSKFYVLSPEEYDERLDYAYRQGVRDALRR
jgi:hypothetical protein